MRRSPLRQARRSCSAASRRRRRRRRSPFPCTPVRARRRAGCPRARPLRSKHGRVLGGGGEFGLRVAREEVGEHLLLGCNGLAEDGDLGGGRSRHGEDVEMRCGEGKVQPCGEFCVDIFCLREFGGEDGTRDGGCAVLWGRSGGGETVRRTEECGGKSGGGQSAEVHGYRPFCRCVMGLSWWMCHRAVISFRRGCRFRAGEGAGGRASG